MLWGIGKTRRAENLRHFLPIRDAIKFSYREHSPGEIKIFVNSINRTIALRGATTDIFCFEKIFLRHEYQSPFLDAAQPSVIVDAGANIGMATLYYAGLYPNATIIAVEPATQNFEMLQKNCFGLSNINLIQGALWPTAGNLNIANPTGESWGFTVNNNNDTSSNEIVSAVTIDDILKTVGYIDILKLDIEGSERELFNSCDAWIDKVGMIVVELHDRIRPGCAKAMYSALCQRDFTQEIRGENIFIYFNKQAIV